MEERKPFYRTAGKGKLYEQEEPIEQDWELMRSYYPETAWFAQGLVEDACDRLDYEGSFIYDQYPDKHSIERVCGGILEKMEGSGELAAMETGGKDFLGELVTALFCQEIYRRRHRRRRCKRFFS